ncbi:MAG: HPr(Ser) kinase/phosphatase [Ruminococcaceae bacterium]|nr:HPr(Ser) kinase/phosphatase [Oscillospiraceae bacterium]
MSIPTYKISLADIMKDTASTAVYLPNGENSDPSKIFVSTSQVNRPGLQLAGFYEYFDPTRIQIIGREETSYLKAFSSEERSAKIEKLFSQGIPVVFVTHVEDTCSEIIEQAKKYGIPVLASEDSTSNVLYNLISSLNVHLAPRITTHGVLVEVYGEGILMIGDSGVGKSETAMELLKRGHRLVADDAVEIKRVSNKTLVGSAPEMIRHLIELRGIGIVDVRRIFGMGAVKETEKIDLIIQLEPWQADKQYERLGLDDNYYELLGLKKPTVTIPIKPGRNLAIIIEVAAMNNRQRRLGYNAAAELNKRLLDNMNNLM